MSAEVEALIALQLEHRVEIEGDDAVCRCGVLLGDSENYRFVRHLAVVLAARDAARDAALREKLAVEVEAGIADLWIPSPVQPGSIAHNELLHDVRSIVVRIIRGAAQ